MLIFLAIGATERSVTQSKPSARSCSVTFWMRQCARRLPPLTPHAMNFPATSQWGRQLWPGSTFGADRGSNRAPNDNRLRSTLHRSFVPEGRHSQRPPDQGRIRASPKRDHRAPIQALPTPKKVVHKGDHRLSPAFSKTPCFTGFLELPWSLAENPSLSANNAAARRALPSTLGCSMARLCQSSVRGVHTNSTLA